MYICRTYLSFLGTFDNRDVVETRSAALQEEGQRLLVRHRLPSAKAFVLSG